MERKLLLLLSARSLIRVPRARARARFWTMGLVLAMGRGVELVMRVTMAMMATT